MPGCSATNCTNNGRKGFKLFLFPRDPHRRAEWAKNCGREGWIPTNNSRICSVHFDNSQFESSRKDGWRKLRPNALPTIFDFHTIQEAPRRSSRQTTSSKSNTKLSERGQRAEKRNAKDQDDAQHQAEESEEKIETSEQAEGSATENPIIEEAPKDEESDKQPVKTSGGIRCAVATCRYHLGRADKSGLRISFHRFPKAPRLRKTWVSKCNRTDQFNPETSYICARHFSTASYLKPKLILGRPARRKLKPDAVPLMNLPHPASGEESELEANASSALQETQESEKNGNENAQDESFHLVCYDYVNLIIATINRLYRSKSGADFTLKNNSDNFEVKLHRWLMQIFASDLPTSDSISLDFSKDVFHMLEEFLYKGRVFVSDKENLEKLHEAATLLRFKPLISSIDKVYKVKSKDSIEEEGQQQQDTAEDIAEEETVENIERTLKNLTESAIRGSQCDQMAAECENEAEAKKMVGETKENDDSASRSNRRRFIKRVFYMRCVHCEFLAPDSSSYAQHISDVHPQEESTKIKRTFSRCQFCEFTGPNQLALRSHWNASHREGRKLYAKCPQCGFTSSLKEVKRHINNKHSTDRPFACDQCEYRATNMKNMYEHRQIHKKINYVCDICNKTISCAANLRKHRRIHLGLTKSFVCKFCNYAFSNITMLNRHLVNIHQEKPVEKESFQFGERAVIGRRAIPKHCCQECDFTTIIPANLEMHVRVKHRNEKPFTCEHCGYNTNSLGNLKSHLKIHSGRKYPCELCGKSYSSNAHLKRHLIVMHDPNAKFRCICQYCGFSTKTADNLNQHIKRRHKLE